MANELIGETAFDDGRFRIIRRLRDREIELELEREGFRDVAPAGEPELHKQRFEPVGVAVLQPEHTVEGRLVEFAAGDETGRDLPLDLLALKFNDHSSTTRPPALLSSRSIPKGKAYEAGCDDFMSVACQSLLGDGPGVRKR